LANELKEAGVLGINQRNLAFIQESNPRLAVSGVDDKTITKQICDKHGIPVPETYAIIRRCKRVARFASDRQPR
jgi:glutathione synthase/RimK-type ligase-like ATP-grasp enzyme